MTREQAIKAMEEIRDGMTKYIDMIKENEMLEISQSELEPYHVASMALMKATKAIVKKTCGLCSHCVSHEEKYCCEYDLAEYYSDGGSDCLRFIKEDQDASGCKSFEIR